VVCMAVVGYLYFYQRHVETEVVCCNIHINYRGLQIDKLLPPVQQSPYSHCSFCSSFKVVFSVIQTV
jgi:hypothetical protein